MFKRREAAKVHSGRSSLCAAASASIAGLGTGCGGDLELPSAPDMSVLSRAYASPNGELTTETAQGLGTEVVTSVEGAREHSPLEIAGTLVGNLQEVGGAETGDDGSGSQESGGRLLRNIDVAAVARLHHACGGWDTSEPTDPARGSVHLTATLDSGGLIPTVWGNFAKCRFVRGNAAIELDGDVRIHLGDDERRLRLTALAQTKYLFEYEGHVTTLVDGVRSDFDLHSHFRVTETGQVQFLLGLSDGTNVLGVFEPLHLDPIYGPSMLTLGLISRDSSWSCSVNLTNASGSCADTNDPTSVVSW